jgi:hypothetical protein
MFLCPCRRKRANGTIDEYWALVESYRTPRGPRQRVVSYLGDLTEATRAGVAAAAAGQRDQQPDLFAEAQIPERVEINLRSLRVERTVAFGGVWLGQWLLKRLGLAEHLAGRTAFAEVLGVPLAKINDDRRYRALDALLPHKAALTQHLRAQGGALFGLTYDLVLYDVTSTYFEGTAAATPQATRGYSRDHRPDCVQLNIALVVDRSGFPIGFEVFPGHRHDSTTVKTMVRVMEKTYGRADRIWVMDRGMVSEKNLTFLRQEGRRFIIGTPKASLKSFEQDLLADGWDTVREGVEVKTCAAPDGSTDHFVLCRSQARHQKEAAMHARFEARIEAGLTNLAVSCTNRTWPVGGIARRVGRLMGAKTRAAGLFDVQVTPRPDGVGAQVTWTHKPEWRDWATLSEGCYLLRSNLDDLPPAEVWTAYIGLTQAEAAFRIQKNDLQLRPIWHQKSERVKAHLLVCFLAFVLWKTLGQCCTHAGLGDEPRRILDEVAQIMLVDVAVETTAGVTIWKRCVAQPTAQQATLLQHLHLTLPTHLGISAQANEQ